MRFRVTIGLWALGAALVGCTGSGSQDAAALAEIERADRMWSQGDIPRAVGVLQTVVAEHPDSFDAWYRLGIHRLDGDLRLAEDALDRAGKLNPEHPGPPFFTAMRRIRFSEFAKADEDMMRADALAQPRLGYSLADTSAAAKEGLDALLHESYGEAAESFARALETDGDNAVLLYLHGRALLRNGAAKEAEDVVQRALALNPDLAVAHVLMSELHRWRKQVEEARREADLALSQNPHLAAAHFQKGALNLEESEFRDAILEFWAAVLDDPTVPRYHHLLGNTLQAASRPQATLHLQHVEWARSFIGRKLALPSYAAPGKP